MNKHPLVSIIMPVYKSEAYIEETILSVINQTYDNIELICVNDCTPDGAFDICMQYRKKYEWIKTYENEKNSGQEVTRNRGLDVATGDFIMFLDSDDTIRQDMIEKMVTIAYENNSDVVMSAYSMYMDEQDIPVLANIDMPPVVNTTAFARVLLDSLEWKILCCIGTKLYRRQVVEDQHLRFEKKYKFNEDGAFILSFLLNCKRVSYIDEPFYQYRIRQAGSTMSSYQCDRFTSISKVNELLRDLFIKHSLFDEKKELYYRKLLFVMIDSLRNEAKFADKKSFVHVKKQIKEYKDYHDMERTLLSSKVLGKKQKAVLWCLRLNLTGLLYLMM